MWHIWLCRWLLAFKKSKRVQIGFIQRTVLACLDDFVDLKMRVARRKLNIHLPGPITQVLELFLVNFIKRQTPLSVKQWVQLKTLCNLTLKNQTVLREQYWQGYLFVNSCSCFVSSSHLFLLIYKKLIKFHAFSFNFQTTGFRVGQFENVTIWT